MIVIPMPPALPAGKATATSFWDHSTASGRRMTYRTLASPYWPLGTKVRITRKDKSTVGVVEDFGPAEYAIRQHNPPALLDISEPMMKRISGSRSNTVVIHFQVIRMGSGKTYRSGGTGYALAYHS
jgi:hypothetical protein